ncbi:MAG TPA: hypothetical protein VFY36_03945 [Solirubrobacteraceae bacterium]|nr:hypothetical protein [Solirubrobacteraceae bacterium]
MLITRTAALVDTCPLLTAEIWSANVEASQPRGHLPSLREAAFNAEAAQKRAVNMSQVFRTLGARGRSPVESQIERASTGALDYSRHNAIVDFLLYAEIWTGILIGFHDASTIGDEVRLGLASDANRSAYEHISKKDITLRSSEPVLLASHRIIGSLRHGPDYATRLTSETKKLWAVAFGSPGETDDELRSLASSICAAGVDFGIWTIASC